MLKIDVDRTGDVAVVRCVGRLVRGEEVCTLRSAVVSQNNTRIVVLDLSEVEMLDAGGLAALLSLRQWSLGRGVQLKLVNPSHFVREVLVRTRLDRVFDISALDHAIFVLAGASCRHAHYAVPA
jgi:anti-anti-sigma factor